MQTARPSPRLQKLAVQFAWYTLFGGLSTLLYWGIYFALQGGLGVDYRLATAIGYGLGSVFNYGLQKVVTFRDSSKKVGRQVTVYAGVQGASMLLSVALMWAFVDGVGLPDLASLVVTTALVLFVNFFGHKLLTFRSPQESSAPPTSSALEE